MTPGELMNFLSDDFMPVSSRLSFEELVTARRELAISLGGAYPAPAGVKARFYVYQYALTDPIVRLYTLCNMVTTKVLTN